MTTKYKTFMDYYRSDPIVKKKQNERQKEQVECDCGTKICKSNHARHKTSKLHKKRIGIKIKEMKKEISRLEKQL